MKAAISEPRTTLRTVTPRLGGEVSTDGAAWSRRRREVSSRTSGAASGGTDCAGGNPARSGRAIPGLKSVRKTRQPRADRWKIVGVKHPFLRLFALRVTAALPPAAGPLAAEPTSQPAS